MAEIAIAAAALPQQFIDFFVTNPRKVAEWRALLQNQPKDIQRLLDEIDETKTHLRKLEQWATEHVAETHRGANLSSIDGIQRKLSHLRTECHTGLETLSRKRFRPFPSVLKKRFETIKDDFSITKTDLSSLTETIMVLPTIPVFVVVRDMILSDQDNLHFNFKKNVDGTSETSEGEMDDAILNSSPPSPTVVVVRGMGGIGKTNALKEIGRRAQANNQKFKDGVLYLSLWQGAGVRDFIEKLAELVEITGGNKEQVQAIRESKTLSTAIRRTGNWFKDRCCLFLFDDVWCTNGITSSIVSDLVGITNHKESKLVFTTHDESLFMGNSRNICFAMKRDSDAQKILLSRSSLSFPESKDGRASFDKILQNCGGLPIALNLAGAWIRQKKCKNGEGVWGLYLKTGFGSDLDRSNEWMKKSVVSSLRLADKETRIPNQFSFEASFPSFSIIRKQQKVPIRIFERMWNLSEKQTVPIMKTLERFSVVEIMYRWKSGNVLCVRLHDRILDVARTLSEEQPSDQPRSSQALIDLYTNYIYSKTGPASSWLDNFQGNWVSVFDERYMSENLVRLLADAGQNDAAIWLTQEPAWIVKQLSKNGSFQIAKDFRIVEEDVMSKPCGLSKEEKQSSTFFFRLVQEICFAISKSDSKRMWNWYPWFQLYGRMGWYAGKRIVGAFLRKVERDSPRPWLKPRLGCLPAADTRLRTMISLGGHPYCHVLDDEEVLVVHRTSHSGCKLSRFDSVGTLIFDVDLEEGSGGNNPNFVKCAMYSVSTGAVILGMRGGDVKLWRISNVGDVSSKDDNSGANSNGEQEMTAFTRDTHGKKWKSAVLKGHDSSVRSVAMNRDGARMVSGSDDHTVRVWDAGENGWKSTVLRGHQWIVCSVAMSENGTRVVSGSMDMTVRVWDKGENGWESSILSRYGRWVLSVAISANGARVVSGSDETTVLVWDLGEKGWESTVLDGHVNKVNSVSISANGARVASGSDDTAVRLWDAGENGWDSIVCGWHKNVVRSVAIRADGAQVVTSSNNWTGQVWDAGENGWQLFVPSEDDDMVLSMKMSANRARVAALSLDGTVRVLDVAEKGCKSVALRWPRDVVQSMEMSADGARVVTNSNDGTVRVWDELEKGWKSVALHEYDNDNVVQSMAMSTDGARVVTSSSHGTVRVWEWQETKWEGKSLGKFDIGVHEVNIAKDSGVINALLSNNMVCHWKYGSEGWVEVLHDSTEESDASGPIDASKGSVTSDERDASDGSDACEESNSIGESYSIAKSYASDESYASESIYASSDSFAIEESDDSVVTGKIDGSVEDSFAIEESDDSVVTGKIDGSVESDGSEESDASGRSGLLTKGEVEIICDAKVVFETSSGFCLNVRRPPFLVFADWIK